MLWIELAKVGGLCVAGIVAEEDERGVRVTAVEI